MFWKFIQDSLYQKFSKHRDNPQTELHIFTFYWRIIMKLINTTELSRILNVSEKTLYHWAQQRKIPCVRLGRLVRFNTDDITKWLETKNDNNSFNKK